MSLIKGHLQGIMDTLQVSFNEVQNMTLEELDLLLQEKEQELDQIIDNYIDEKEKFDENEEFEQYSNHRALRSIT